MSAEESATRACEERLKEGLKSPASYRRLWSSFTPAEKVTKAEYVEKLEADRLRAVREGNDANAFISASIKQCLERPNRKECEGMPKFEQMPRSDTAFVLIEYEAVNAFNVALPGYYSCRMNIDDEGNYEALHIFTGTTVPYDLGKKLKAQAELMK